MEYKFRRNMNINTNRDRPMMTLNDGGGKINGTQTENKLL